MDFTKIPKEYRPIPFWSWNEKLDTEETVRQIHMMDEVGIGGFFMHARGGLQTEYMGEEWFSNVTAAKDEAEKRGMYAWAYDENGWPSGFGDGAVNSKGVEYQQKYLRMSEDIPRENLIGKCGEHWFYFDVNPFYVDTLDKKVIAEFIKTAYQPYFDRYRNGIEGFFTDEPQISRNGIPWSFVFESEYMNRYGENILEHLEELFLPVSDYRNTRVKFWKMVTDLFSEAFLKQIYDWCEEHGLKFTGHLVCEETLYSQLTSNGACMPHYEYLHMPGMDWLGRKVFDCLTAKQVSSVCEQLGKDRVLSETFALCGHNVSFDELKGIYEWQMVRGINMLCQHLEGYSLRGIRKRDYPPAMYYQQPWWSEYSSFVDAMSREGMLLSKGKKKAEVLLIHPQTTAWSLFDNGESEGLKELNEALLEKVKELEQMHIEFHFGDETIMERHAEVKDGKIIIGCQEYSYILNPLGEILLDNTKRLLKEFEESGGRLNVLPPSNEITDNGDITYTKREFEDFTLHFFVNTYAEQKVANINVKGKKLDIYTGDLCELTKSCTFEPWGSLMVIEDGQGEYAKELPEDPVFIKGMCRIKGAVENVLTLDRCDYSFDGELQEKDGYVLDIAERANSLGKAVHIKQTYRILAEYVPEKLYLVCETPEKFTISVNDENYSIRDEGYFMDKSFRKLDISGLLKEGENTLTFECDFVQSKQFYKNLKKAYVFESEKNKLVYDMEIEAVYLVGDFAVKTDSIWEEIPKKASRYGGKFILTSPKKEILPDQIEKQGFPFFSGELTLETEIDVSGENPVLVLDKKGVNAVRVQAGDVSGCILTGNKFSLKGLSGKTKVKLTLINNLRNMLGPHHLKSGESYMVGPNSFFKEPCIWNGDPQGYWDDRYCFVEFGI